MSRYTIEPAEWPDEFSVIVGWDPGLSTYFAQVYRGNPYKADSECLLWLGNVEQINTVDALLQQLNASFAEDTPPVEIPDDIRKQMEADAAEDED